MTFLKGGPRLVQRMRKSYAPLFSPEGAVSLHYSNIIGIFQCTYTIYELLEVQNMSSAYLFALIRMIYVEICAVTSYSSIDPVYTIVIDMYNTFNLKGEYDTSR